MTIKSHVLVPAKIVRAIATEKNVRAKNATATKTSKNAAAAALMMTKGSIDRYDTIAQPFFSCAL